MDVYEAVAQFMNKNRLVPPGERIVVGVSGGPDSLCLLDCLHHIGYPLVLAHLNHQLRPESGLEAEYVSHAAKRFGIPAVVERAEVEEAATRERRSIEEAARLLRYRFLVRVATKHHSCYVATGHTADDQAETILMHLLRGAGPAGLRGMLPRADLTSWVGIPGAEGIQLVRPLLDITREQTEAHCAAAGFEPRVDASNVDRTFFRNRLRHELLPLLEQYNPAIRRVLRRTGRLMTEITSFLEDKADDVWAGMVRSAGDGVLALRADRFLAQPRPLQWCILGRAMKALRPELRDVGFEGLERAAELISRGHAGMHQSMTGGLELVVFDEEILLRDRAAKPTFPQYPQLVGDLPSELAVPGVVNLAGGWRLESDRQTLTARGRSKLIDGEGTALAALDAAKLDGVLEVRPVRRGERMQPLGMGSPVKISSLFVNLHIPQPARARWPLVACCEKPVWLAGLRMTHLARLTRSSRETVILRVTGPESGP